MLILIHIINGYFHLIANDIIHRYKYIFIFEKITKNRDLKPDNILISNNIYKIADFSWSCYAEDNDYEFAGTPLYMSP